MANGKEATLMALKNLAKTIFNKEEVVELKFKDEKLTDGTIIRYEDEVLAVGTKVMIVTEDGQVLPMPIGSYVTETGTAFDVVSEDGSIDNVVIAPDQPATEDEVMESEAPATVAPQAAPAPTAQPKSVIESVVKETRFEDEANEKFASIEKTLEDKYNDLVEKFNSQTKTVEALENNLKQMFSLIEQMGETPSTKSTETKVNQFKKQMTAKDARQYFREQLFNKK